MKVQLYIKLRLYYKLRNKYKYPVELITQD